MKTLALALSALGLTAINPLHAAQVTPISYDTANGSGQASGGSFNYWDLGYNGSGATTTDGAPLTGGVGDLTDGVIASQQWFNVENAAGTGPYVGWLASTTANPLINFTFAGNPVINRILVHFDNSRVGGVFRPDAIWIDGANSSYVPPAFAGLYNFEIAGLNLTGNSHSLQLFQESNAWVFVSEIQFFSDTAVPEPASWALMILGFGLVGTTLRSSNRRRKHPSCA